MGVNLAQASEEISVRVNDHKKYLQQELADLRGKLLEEQGMAQRASAMGDRSENAEWQIASDNIARYMTAIVVLEDTLSTYEKYQSAYTPTGKVTEGSCLRLSSAEQNVSFCFKIYPVGMGNARLGALTTDTPMGEAVMGKRAGDTVIVRAPIGNVAFYIEEVF